MATTLASFEAGHGDMVHDVQLDYYGRRLATASSDRCIKVFDVASDQVTSFSVLHGCHCTHNILRRRPATASNRDTMAFTIVDHPVFSIARLCHCVVPGGKHVCFSSSKGS